MKAAGESFVIIVVVAFAALLLGMMLSGGNSTAGDSASLSPSQTVAQGDESANAGCNGAVVIGCVNVADASHDTAVTSTSYALTPDDDSGRHWATLGAGLFMAGVLVVLGGLYVVLQ